MKTGHPFFYFCQNFNYAVDSVIIRVRDNIYCADVCLCRSLVAFVVYTGNIIRLRVHIITHGGKPFSIEDSPLHASSSLGESSTFISRYVS